MLEEASFYQLCELFDRASEATPVAIHVYTELKAAPDYGIRSTETLYRWQVGKTK